MRLSVAALLLVSSLMVLPAEAVGGNSHSLIVEQATAGTGMITGRVTDRMTGEPLPGANVRVAGTTIGAATDPSGRYVITSVPAGPQTLIATYLGYEQQEQAVEVVAGGSVQVDFQLAHRIIEGAEVVVTAQVAGQLAAINEQFQDPIIKNVVSRDRIQELPDINAAESIGRLPGVSIQRSGGEATRVAIRGMSPRFNTVTVAGVRLPSTDGNDRSVDLSLISSNILDGIELRKAVTPDMDPDVIGGSIDLRLRSAPPGLHLDILGQGGYTGLQNEFGNYKVVGTASQRFLDDRLGAIFTFNADRFDRSADKLGIQYTDATRPGTDEKAIRINSLNLREELVDRSRLGGSVLLDFTIPRGRIMANTFYNELRNDALFRFFSPTTDHLTYNVEQRSGTTSLMTSSLGVEQHLGPLRYDVQVALTRSRSKNPNDYIWNFARDGSAFIVGRNDLFDISADSAFALVRQDSLAPLANLWVDTRRLEEDQRSISLNLQVPFRFGGWISGHLQGGGRLRGLDRQFDQERNGRQGLQYPGLWGTPEFACLRAALGPAWEERLARAGALGYLPISQVRATHLRRANFLGGAFGLGYVADHQLLMELTRALQSSGCSHQYLTNTIASLGQDYEGIERYQAGYLMARLDIGRYVTLIPGFRYERDYSKYVGQRFREVVNAFRDAPPADLETLVIERENVFWLPMVHLDIRPLDWLSIRLARTETIARPGFRQYAPITSINTWGSYIQAANSLLRPSQATNHDVSVQLINTRFGLIGVSYFSKTIDDLILPVEMPVNRFVGSPEGTNVPEAWLAGSPLLQTYINNEDPATVRGFEFEWQTNFSWLPGLLRGLVLNVNYTRSFSETTYRSYRLERRFIPGSRPPQFTHDLIETARKGRMPDQAAHIANVTVGFDYGGFSARLSFLFQSNTTSYINPREPLLDGFVGDYYRFDMSLRQLVGHGVELFANLNNLNNRPDQTFTGQNTLAPDYKFSEDHPAFRELYGYTVDVGVRFRF